MSNFTDGRTDCSTFRSTYPTKVKSHLFTAAMINQVYTQSADGLDGIRIYAGIDDLGDFSAFMVGVKKDANGNYNDVNIEAATIKARPCPVMCSTSNALNS